ncbi:OB-fold-containig protein [Bosea sp. RAC05]|uniref:OB-fold-containig protein n=1 Tax=Bosea sp. RAC05 TaxID=1842539 RepID=UPI00083D5B4A|nr:OB-fold-containig protein [Bosea sp. RAC05]AOG02846.1 hypothetical protein BSY19_4725 [Bosea sp. RAC05]
MALTDFEALLQPEYQPFAVAAMVMLGLVLFEGLAVLLGFSALKAGDPDIDVDFGDSLAGALMSWVNPGRVPLLVLIIAFLAAFSATGFVLQSFLLAQAINLPTAIVAICAATIAVPLSKLASRGIAAIIPRDETYVVSLDLLVGRHAVVTLGPLDQGSAGRVRVLDNHGNWHFLPTKAAQGQADIPTNAKVILVDRDGGTFFAAALPADFININ